MLCDKRAVCKHEKEKLYKTGAGGAIRLRDNGTKEKTGRKHFRCVGGERLCFFHTI